MDVEEYLTIRMEKTEKLTNCLNHKKTECSQRKYAT